MNENYILLNYNYKKKFLKYIVQVNVCTGYVQSDIPINCKFNSYNHWLTYLYPNQQLLISNNS